MRRITLPAALLLLLLAARASPLSMPRSDLMVGYHGTSSHYAEVGWALHNSTRQASINSSASQGYSLSTELRMGNGFIMGGEASAWSSILFMEAGANLILYTDFHQASLRLRPELGFKVSDFLISFGYNAPMKGPKFDGVNAFDLGVRGIFPL